MVAVAALLLTILKVFMSINKQQLKMQSAFLNGLFISSVFSNDDPQMEPIIL